MWMRKLLYGVAALLAAAAVAFGTVGPPVGGDAVAEVHDAEREVATDILGIRW